MTQVLIVTAALATIGVALTAMIRWFLKRRSRIEEREVDPQTFLERSGLGARLQEAGYKWAWIPAYKIHERRAQDGWELVVEQERRGVRVCYRHGDSPAVGGYVMLHKKKLGE